LTAPDDTAPFLMMESPAPVAPWFLRAPRSQTAPVVFSSPHSGRDYPSDFIAASRLDILALRRSEDAFVDEVFAAAPDVGAPLICARFPRAYVDANREAFELDPEMFDGPLPDYVNTRSPRVSAGLGTIARVVSDGEPIYARPLRFEDARRRIESHHKPYHDALRNLVGATKRRFGACLLVDCHSMPSGAGPKAQGGNGVDIVLGDCYGTACAAEVTDTAERALVEAGFSVVRNKPYAGGFTTRHYGRPRDGIHVLQIEVNRGLYMDETRVRRADGLPALVERLVAPMRAIAAIDPVALATA